MSQEGGQRRFGIAALSLRASAELVSGSGRGWLVGVERSDLRRNHPPLVGRDVELSRIVSALESAAEGTLKFVLLEGEPGVGKTRLITEAFAQVGPLFRVLSGQGHELGRDKPFGMFVDALGLDGTTADPDREAIAALLNGSPTARDDLAGEFAELRYLAIEGIVALLRQWAQEEPLLLGLEDLHWADASSVLTLDQLMKRLSELPIGVVATRRHTPGSPALEQLGRGLSSEDGLRIRLAPLGTDAVGELAASLVGAAPGPGLLRQMEGAAGNPFFVTEMIAALSDEDRIEVSGEVAEASTEETVTSLRSTVLHRLGFLPLETLELLRVASVIGSRFRLDDLSVVLSIPVTELLGPLREPIDSGFMVGSGEMLEFRHHLVWDALYHDLPLAAREALHAQVARRLAAAHRPATQVATHFMAGASPGDREAIVWLERAAGEALSRAPDVAAELLEGAVHIAGDAGEIRDRLAVDLATALTWAGRLDKAEAIIEDLVARVALPQDAVDVRLGLARIHIIKGKPFAARAQFELLADSPGLRGRRRARSLFDQAVACLMSGDVAGADIAARAALDEGTDLGDDPSVCGALCALAWVANLRGRTFEAVELAERAVAVAESSPVRETGRRYPHVFLGVVLVDADQLDYARRMFDGGRRLAEAFGDAWQLPIHHLGAALVAFYAGSLDDAMTALATADEIVEEVGTRVLHVWSSALWAHIAIERDELEDASRLLGSAEQHVADSGPGMGYDWLLWGRARLLEAEGDLSAAVAVLDNAWSLADSLGIVSQRRLIGPDLVRMLRAAGHGDRAQEVAEAMASAAESSVVASSRAAAERCMGLAWEDGDRMLAAAGMSKGSPRRLEYARTCEDAADVLIGSGRDQEAKAMLIEAGDVYRDCGARRGERRVDASLRGLGVTRGRRGTRSRPAVGWEALTPAEVEVSELAAQGLTNPEIGRRLFVSPRTVESHLSHVYAKLGISSRVELAAAAAARHP